MPYVDIIERLHTSTKRDYLSRVLEVDKAEAAAIAKRFDHEYWDGDRRHGYGGYRYDGRYRPVAEAFVRHYGLQNHHRILDVGCGKGFLLYELTQLLPGVEIAGLDISAYALENAKEETRPFLVEGSAVHLPWPDRHFDLVISLGTIHNLYVYDLKKALQEVERVGRERKFVSVDSYRNERERINLMYWQLTCEVYFTPSEWEWFFDLCGYTGDYGFLFFE